LIGSKFKTKMAKIETFNLNENLLIDYDYDGLGDMEMGSFEDIGPMVGSISTLNAPSGSKKLQSWTFWTLKQQLHGRLEGMGSLSHIFFPLAFFHTE
jgi:hypothetical protein